MIEDSSFRIAENIQPVYTGVYKNGVPFNGYFKKDILDKELFAVDYYKDGVKTYQYSFDLLKFLMQMDELGIDEGDPKLLDIKSVYADNKIVDGDEFIEVSNGIKTKKWKQGVLMGFTIDVFAVHYYNRLTFLLVDGVITIQNFVEKNSEIKLSFEEGKLSAALLYEGEILVYKGYYNFDENNLPPNSRITCFSDKDNLKYSIYSDKLGDIYHDLNVGMGVFRQSYVPEFQTANVLLVHLSETYQIENWNEKPGMKHGTAAIVAYLYTNEKGTINRGIHWVEHKDGATSYQIYENNKIIKTEEINLEDFQPIAREYIKTLPHD